MRKQNNAPANSTIVRETAMRMMDDPKYRSKLYNSRSIPNNKMKKYIISEIKLNGEFQLNKKKRLSEESIFREMRNGIEDYKSAHGIKDVWTKPKGRDIKTVLRDDFNIDNGTIEMILKK